MADPFNFHFDFDDEGNMVASGPRRRLGVTVTDKHGKPVPGSADAPAGFSAFSGGFTNNTDDAVPEELIQKIRAVMAKLAYYKRRLKIMKDREKHHEKEFQNTARRLAEAERELEEFQENAADLGGVRGQTKHVEGLIARKGEGNRQRRNATRQLYSGFDVLEAEAETEDVKNLSTTRRLLRNLQWWLESFYPLTSDCSQINARFGSSVGSYFRFFRWIVLQSIAVSFIAIFFLVSHVSKGSFGWGLVGNVLPELMLVSSFQTTEAMDYCALLLLTHFVLIVAALRKWIKEDFEEKQHASLDSDSSDDEDEDALVKERKKKKFAKLLLNAWDHTRLDSNDLKAAIGQNLLLIQHEDEVLEQMTKRKFMERVCVYSRRVAGMIASLAVLGVAGLCIVALTIYSSSLESDIAETQLAAFAAFIVPVCVTLINAIQPVVIIKIAKLEKWDDPGQQVKYTVWRLFVAKLVNVLLQVTSFSLLADPLLLRGRSFGIEDMDVMRAGRVNLEKAFTAETSATNGFTCRMDQAGLGLFQLVLAEFIFGKILAVVFPYIFMALAVVKGRIRRAVYVFWSGLRSNHYVRPQFDVAKKMVNLLYFTQLALMSLPLNPFASILSAIFAFVNFKFEKWTLRKYFVKPVKPWSAKDAGAFFVKFYLLSLFVAMLGLALLMTNRTFPKSCDTMQTIVDANYAGINPYCDHVSDINTQLQTEASAATRRSLASQLGGEVTYWLAEKCPSQCQSVFSLTSAECVTKCSNVEDIILECDVATAINEGGKLKGQNLTKPCDFACGPWVSLENGYAALVEFCTDGRSTFDAIRLLYVSAQEPAVIWVLCLLLLVFGCFKWNSVDSIKKTAHEQQAHLEGLIGRLKKKTDKQSKQIAALRRAARDDNAADDER